MPEGPEVQVVVSTLERQLQDHTIAKVNVFYEKLIAYPSVDQFCQQLQGQKFHAFSRIGKYLLFTLDTSILVVHLRMEGRFYIYDRPPAFCKHIHSIWQMDDGFYSCVAVVAGSNTRFYHTCEVISSTLVGLACRIEHTSLGLVS